MAWTWRYEGSGGEPVEGMTSTEAFPSQADAETFVGETWRELREQGVVAVTLFEDDREVYGPMGLDPA